MSVLHAPLHAVGCTLECLHVLHAVLSNSMQWCVDCGLKHVLQTIKCTGQYLTQLYVFMFHVQYVWYMMSFREQEVVCCMLHAAGVTHCHKLQNNNAKLLQLQ